MNAYAIQINALVEAVVDRTKDSVTSLVSAVRADQFSPAERVAIYADGYQVRLCAAVAADYPALAHYLGVDAFNAALSRFVRTYPSRQWDLNLYPIGFAAFIYSWRDDAAARAIADLESAITEVFWRPDSMTLNPADLATLSMDQLALYSFQPRSALKLLRLDASANHYLTAFRAGVAPEYVSAEPEHVCVVRHHNEVRRLTMDTDEYALLSLLCAGLPFGAALDHLNGKISEAALMPLMTQWLNAGVFQSTPAKHEIVKPSARAHPIPSRPAAFRNQCDPRSA